MKEVQIAILGMGTIASGVYELIGQEGEKILHRDGIKLNVAKVLSLEYSIDIPEEKKVRDIEEIVNDKNIDIVVELMGGTEPAKTFITKCLTAGKSVVSANKMLIASHWPEIEKVAKSTDAGFYFEASVGGGIPLLRTILDSLNANSITSVMGIINGTTNYILTKMAEEGRDYADALGEAQALGFAEANPDSDVLGQDAMYKLSILASICFHAKIPVEFIHTEGITSITPEDIKYAEELGYCIKLLAIGKRRGEKIEVRVHPTMISKNHPLSSVRGSFNAVFIHGNYVDDVMLYGHGAGKFPTASAVVSDIILAAKTTSHKYMTFQNENKVPGSISFENDWQSAYYLNIEAMDKPGVLAKISSVFSKYYVSLSSVIQKGRNESSVPLIFVTHSANEMSIKRAIEDIKYIPEVTAVKNTIRVEN